MKKYLRYNVTETGGRFVASFHSYNHAIAYKVLYGKPNLKIEVVTDGDLFGRYNYSTKKQRAIVKFYEDVLDIEFAGNINCMSDCLIFLAEHKNEVKLALDKEDFQNNVTQEVDFSLDDKLDEDILDADIDDWPFHDEIIIPKR